MISISHTRTHTHTLTQSSWLLLSVDSHPSAHPRQLFTQSVGPTVPISDSPLEIFQLLFTPEVHCYRDKQVCRPTITARKVDATDGCRAQGLYRFLHIDGHIPSLEDYWKKTTLFQYSPQGIDSEIFVGISDNCPPQAPLVAIAWQKYVPSST